VNATGSGNNHYQYNDSIHSQQGLVFYRLKMVDIDGTYKYSPVVKLLNGQNNQLIVFPSPAKDVITIFVSDNSLLQSLVYLYDANGRMLRRETLTKNLQQLSIENLAGGFYFLKFKNGEAARFVKQ
jgi:hypothetical protein